MAKARSESGVNKSAEIRNYLNANGSASSKDVVAALKERGITVSEGLVNNVKSSLRRKSGAGGKRVVRRRGRRGGVNMSAAIRSYLEQHPKAVPSQIREALKAEQGLDVSVGLISAVKYGKKSSAGRGKLVVRRRGAAASGAAATGLSVDDLIAVKGLADRLGGIREARHALDALEQLIVR